MSDQSPTGTVTFLFTDIQDSTGLWERHPSGMPQALARHDAIMHQAVTAQRGSVVKTTGDGIYAVFGRAADAVTAALAAQRALQTEAWKSTDDEAIRVRMGLHSGEAQERDGDYFGQAVNRAARLMSIGHGGQILLSARTAELVRGDLKEAVTLQELGEVRLRGLNRPELVFQLSAGDLPGAFPPLRTEAAWLGNLPAQLTSFVGREKELADVARLLQETRLLTLTGPGGTGKTRLSLEAAGSVEENYAQSVWFVELAPIRDPEDVVTAVAALWNLSQGPNQSLLQILVEYLRGKELLLILDNCEHLVEACARLAAELLRHAPRLTILASSREGLGVPGETTYHLPTLPLPPEEERDPQVLQSYASVQLFLDRAASAKAGFRLTEENAGAANHIVRRLDGIPLAIELAATRLRLMSPEQLAGRLDDRFRLLTGGSRTALPRQQTLRALIDWSYGLLEPAEQALFRRLSVFSGGWSLAAAETIAELENPRGFSQSTAANQVAPKNLAGLNILDLLSRLVDKSLVIMEAADGRTRFHYLETIRQYARDRLFEEGESAAALNSQLAYVRSLALKEPLFRQGDDFVTHIVESSVAQYQDWIADLQPERDNARSAMSWALETDPESALELATALSIFTGGWPLDTVRSWLSQSMDKVKALPPVDGRSRVPRDLLLVRGALALANLLVDQGSLIEAAPWVKEAEEVARAHGFQHEVAAALSIRTNIEFFLEQPQTYDSARETAAIYEELNSDALRAFPLLVLADLKFRQGDGDAAEALRSEALQAVTGSDLLLEATVYGFAGSAAMWQGDLDTASDLLARAAAEFERQGNYSYGYDINGELGALRLRTGDLDGAEAVLIKTLHVFKSSGNQIRLASVLEYFAILALKREQLQRAAQLFGAAEALRDRIELPLLPYERESYDAAVTILRDKLAEEQFLTLWADGRRLSGDQAIDLALSREQLESG